MIFLHIAKILSNSWQLAKPFTPCAARTIIFQRKNLNYLIVCFTQSTLFFQKVCFLFQICLLCVFCGTYVTKINAVLWQTTRETFASLGLFTFARIACLLQLWIKTSERDYFFILGDAPIKSVLHVQICLFLLIRKKECCTYKFVCLC